MTRNAPWSATRAAKRIITPDDEWARVIRMRILADAHPWQRDGIVDPHELVSFRVGRGGAKTTTKRARAIIKLTTLRNQRIGYAATSKEQARDLNWEPLKRACEAYEIRTSVTNVISKTPDITFTDAQMIATCHRTGSIYKLRGVEDKRDAEKFRGFPQAEFQIDEAGSFPPELLRYLIEDCVQPRIGEAFSIRYLDEIGDQVEITNGGCIVMGSTPPARLVGLFYEATKPSGDMHRPYAEREERNAEWSSHSWTLEDVVKLDDAEAKYPALWHLWLKALERKERKGWADDHPVWCREYLGRWAADFTTTVFKFSPERNLWKPCGDRPLEGMPLLEAALAALPSDVGPFRHVLTMDNGGTRDPFACNVFSFAPADTERRLFHTFCFEKMQHGVRPVSELLVGPAATQRALNGEASDVYDGIFGRIGWPDALEFDADDSTISELANVYGIKCRKADRRADYKFGATELVNGDLMSGRILVIDRTPLHSQLVELQWRADEYGRLKENPAQANHCTDCLIYAHRLVANLYESGAVTHEAPAKAPAVRHDLDVDEPDADEALLSDAGYSDYDYGNDY